MSLSAPGLIPLMMRRATLELQIPATPKASTISGQHFTLCLSASSQTLSDDLCGGRLE